MSRLGRTFSVEAQSTTGTTVQFPSELRYEFTTNNLEGRPGQCTLRIFNAGDNTLGSIYVGTVITLRAGYVGAEDSIIFKGHVTNFYNFRQGADLITELHCADWGTAFMAPCNSTLFKSATVRQLIASVAKQMVLTTPASSATGGKDVKIAVTVNESNIVLNPKVEKSKPDGLQITNGTCSQYMRQLAEQHEFLWYVRQGSFHTRPNTPNYQPPEAPFEVSAENGMLQTPTIEAKGVTALIMMNPYLRIGDTFMPVVERSVTVISNNFYAELESFRQRENWTQRVHEIIHTGDTRGNQWQTSIKGIHVIQGA